MKKIGKWQIALIALAIATIIFSALPVIGYVYGLSGPLKHLSFYGIWKHYYAREIDQQEVFDTVYPIEDLGIVLLPLENRTGEYTVRIRDPDKALK
jgi:hypothetical protein